MYIPDRRPPPREASVELSDELGAVARARTYGLDISMLEAALRRTPLERLRRLDANMEFVRRFRGAAVP